ncbi:hypothetical protein TKK_0006154 [Trichogramma kaykai]
MNYQSWRETDFLEYFDLCISSNRAVSVCSSCSSPGDRVTCTSGKREYSRYSQQSSSKARAFDNFSFFLNMNFTTKWIKTGRPYDFVFVSKEVVATASGYYVIFYNLSNGEERIEYFNSQDRGNGVSCLCAHPVISVFSTAERCRNPRLLVHTYPEIRRVASCKLTSNTNAYVSCCFSGSEYLVSLTSIPNYQLVVWLWRTGHKLAQIDSGIADEFQLIQPSPYASHLVYQFSSRLDQLLTFEIYAYSKKATITKNEISLIKNEISCISWTNNNNLLISDVYGNVYIASSDGKKFQMIFCHETRDRKENVILSLNFGYIISENNSQLTCYTKSLGSAKESWKAAWSIKCSSVPVKIALVRHKEAFLVYCENGDVNELCLTNDSKPEMKTLLKNCRKILCLKLLKSDDEFCVCLDELNYLIVFNAIDGYFVTDTKIPFQDQVACLEIHPKIPLISISTISGKCIFFVFSSRSLHEIKMIHILRYPIEIIKFSNDGSVMGAISKNKNDIFILNTVENEAIQVLYHVPMSYPVVDILIFVCEKKVKFMILTNSLNRSSIGNIVDLYELDEINESLIFISTFEMPCSYHQLKYGFDDATFIGQSHFFKRIQIFDIQDDFRQIIVKSITPSEHLLKKFDIFVSEKYTITSGFDGLVFIRENLNSLKFLDSFNVHHYRENGSKESLLIQSYKMIVTLGRDGSIVAQKFCELEESEEKAQKRKIANIFQWKCDQINELPFGITWLEEKQLRYEENEKKLYLDLKHKLEHELCELREKVKNILDLNESKNEFCQLTLSDFDILKYRRENLLKKALQNEVENEQRVQEIIKAKEKIIDFIIHSFWEPLRVHDRTILSFSHNTRISNFTIPNDAPPEQLYDSTIELFNTPFNDPVTIIDHENFDGNKEQKHFCSEYSNEDAFSGTTSFKWINNDMSRDQLLEPSLPYVTSDFVNLCENKLKMVFNEKFNLMVQLKSNVLKKNTDLLKIQNDCRAELKRVFGILPESDEFSNVNWKSTEDLDAACAPTEKDATYSYDSNFYCDEDDLTLDDLSNINPLNSVTIEQAKFREEALKRMMDGVLEIRWEDEIKKNIPKPLCLLLKKPSKYDIKDLIAIKTYKNKVDKLQKERQKYRLQLEEKIDSINSRIKADIEMFDKKMEMLAMEKLNVQSAIFQEFLLRFQHVKLSLGHQQNEKLMRTLNDNFESLEKKCKLVATDINHVEQTVIDLRIKFEGLSRRDKAVETKFRTEFADLKQPMVEHLLRQYKRRPNVEKIIYTSLTFLLEANKCLTSGKKSVILPQEYLEFLSFMDSLDVMPNSLPPQIEASHWQSLCKLRRNKVDLEFKLRIASLELSESEHTLLYLQKLHSVIQSKMSSTRNSIETAKSKQLKLLSDNDVQLVLKTAQIEIVTTGETSNYVNATFVFFTKLIEINSAILREGKRKISEMHSLVALKKSIKFQNWKRKCTVKRLNHSKDHFLVLQSTKIQKDMQTYLVERLKKCKKQKDIHQCEKMLKSVEKKFQRMLTEKQKEVTHLVTEINYWQRMNSVLIRDLERSTQLKENKALTLKEDHCRNKNQLFKKSYLSFIMKRNCLSRKLKENHEEITNLQWQLEILKLKTYPTLRFKDVPFSKYHESIRKSF